MTRWIITLAALALCSQAQAASWQVECNYEDYAKDKFLDGKCEITEGQGATWTVTLPDRSEVAVEWGKRRGASLQMKVDGREAWAHEINREHLYVSSNDLEQSIEWWPINTATGNPSSR